MKSGELLDAFVKRVSQYTTGRLTAGVTISYSAWNAFQGLLGKGELRRRDYGPALDGLFRAGLLNPTGESIRDRADLEIRWPLVVTAEAVRECRTARRRLTSRFWYPIKNWVSQRVRVFSVLGILSFLVLVPEPLSAQILVVEGNVNLQPDPSSRELLPGRLDDPRLPRSHPPAATRLNRQLPRQDFHL